MLIYTTGNIFLSSAKALVNPVNCVGISGKGLALAFRYRFPSNYEAYRNVCKKDELKIGSLYVYYGTLRTIINFPTKNHWKSFSKIEYIEKGLDTLVKKLDRKDTEKLSSIAIPALGCGLGGLDWKEEVRPMIKEKLSNIDTPIYVYEPVENKNEKNKTINVSRV